MKNPCFMRGDPAGDPEIFRRLGQQIYVKNHLGGERRADKSLLLERSLAADGIGIYPGACAQP
jgi:hypothetical protein